MKIEATFVRSAATAADLPRDTLAEVALVGRSNVGKSSLINALVRQRVARTSGAPGKTRLANIYRVGRGGSTPFYLVDLPGYGFARGGPEAARAFDEITRIYFGLERQANRDRQENRDSKSALLIVDARHPGLPADADAWRWLQSVTDRIAIAVTKIDKLSRAERHRALPRHEATYEHPVVAVSAVTGEGLDELWKLIDRMTKSG